MTVRSRGNFDLGRWFDGKPAAGPGSITLAADKFSESSSVTSRDAEHRFRDQFVLLRQRSRDLLSLRLGNVGPEPLPLKATKLI